MNPPNLLIRGSVAIDVVLSLLVFSCCIFKQNSDFPCLFFCVRYENVTKKDEVTGLVFKIDVTDGKKKI